MKIIAEDMMGNKDTTTGKHVRLTKQGCFVDNHLWHSPGEGVFILDITEG